MSGRTAGVLAAGVVLACGEPAPKRPRPVELEVPSTGVYEVTARVLADSCVPAYVAPAPWRSFVDARAGRDTARVDFSASAVPPETRTDRPGRRSVSIVPPQVDRVLLAMPDFPGPIGEQIFAVTRYARDGFTLVITVKDGDADAPGCVTRVEHEFRVVEPMCAASCTRAVRASAVERVPGETERMQVECDCAAPRERPGPESR